MGLFNSLFGGSENTLVTVLLALGIVLVLIVLGLWALKLLFNATGNVGRGRNRRLNVIDSTAIDQKRHLVLVRRDDVEHLLVVGGPQDIVVETGITPPAEPAQAKRPRRGIVPVPERQKPAAQEPQPAPRAAAPARSAPEPEIAATVATEAAPVESEAPTAPKRAPSLRHTGLLRPAGRVEPAFGGQSSTGESDKTEARLRDSAKTAPEAANTVREEPVIDDADKSSGGNESSSERDRESKAKATT